MRRFLSAIAMVAASWAAPAAAQIPVFDAGSIAQAIEQLKALQAHMDQLKQTHASFNKITMRCYAAKVAGRSNGKIRIRST
jgi:Skp family chaperone for outer membrane proteins